MQNWEYKKLGDVCDVKCGATPLKSDKSFWENGNIPWFTVDDIRHQGRIITTTQKTVTDKALNKLTLFPKDTILLCCTASVGEYAITTIPLTCNQQFNGLIIKNKENLYPKYLYHFSSTLKERLLSVSGKTTIDFVSNSKVCNIEIPLPPLDEQKRIVKILDEKFAMLETVKANAKTNLQNAKDLFQSQLTKAFSNTTWEKKRLGDLCAKIVDGTHNSPPNTREGDYQYITAKNIKITGIDLSDITYVSKEIHDAIYSRCNPEKGDVLLIKDGATTGIAVVNELDYEFSLLSSVALLKFDKNILNPYCLAYLLNSDETYKRFRAKMEGAAITRLTLVKIKDFEIPLPPLPEQKRIVEQLDSLSEKVRSLEALYTKQLANCDELKQAFLAKAFAGEL